MLHEWWRNIEKDAAVHIKNGFDKKYSSPDTVSWGGSSVVTWHIKPDISFTSTWAKRPLFCSNLLKEWTVPHTWWFFQDKNWSINSKHWTLKPSVLPKVTARSLTFFCVALYRVFSALIFCGYKKHNKLCLYLLFIPHLSASCVFSSKSISFNNKSAREVEIREEGE